MRTSTMNRGLKFTFALLTVAMLSVNSFADDKVEGILVNIFGGIMKCDVIATGVIEAAKQIGVEVPLVVRLEGTNVELGKQLLAESGLNIVSADGMADAAEKIVKAVKG